MTNVYISSDESDDPVLREQLRQIKRVGDMARAAVPYLKEVFGVADYVDVSWQTDAPPKLRPWITGYLGTKGIRAQYRHGQAGNTLITVRREDGVR